MKNFTIFYANQIWAELDSLTQFMRERVTCGPELYNGAKVYYKKAPIQPNRHWFNMDGTPVLDIDVPPELKAWVLIL